MKICTKCKISKPLLKFHKMKASKDGHQPLCIDCSYSIMKPYILKRQRLLLYGVTPEQYEKLILDCNNSCQLCGTKRENLKRDLSIDHCHKTGKIRGMLCSNCNHALGKFKDSIELLEKAIKYLNT